MLGITVTPLLEVDPFNHGGAYRKVFLPWQSGRNRTNCIVMKYNIFLRHFKKLLCLLFIVPICMLFISMFSRGTVQNLVELPYEHENVYCRFTPLWMLGRCYVREDVRKAVLQAAKRLSGHENPLFIAYLDGSRKNGGKLFPHASHQTGRDLDIVYIARDEHGNSQPSGPSLLSPTYFLITGETSETAC